MRVEATRADWIVVVWLNRGDIESLQESSEIDVALPRRGHLSIQRVDGGKTRVARVGDYSARMHLPTRYLLGLEIGRIRSVKGVNGALPLSVEVRAEPGVGLFPWLSDRDQLEW